ncbi:MAG: hypothetical protein ACI9VT_003918 [Psychroserpens sp.]|jgi:hypothetical protein
MLILSILYYLMGKYFLLVSNMIIQHCLEQNIIADNDLLIVIVSRYLKKLTALAISSRSVRVLFIGAFISA